MVTPPPTPPPTPIPRSTVKPVTLADQLECDFDEGHTCHYSVSLRGKVNDYDEEFKWITQKGNEGRGKGPKSDVSGSGKTRSLLLIEKLIIENESDQQVIICFPLHDVMILAYLHLSLLSLSM